MPFAIYSFTLAVCFYGYVLFVRFDYDLIIPGLKAPKILPQNLDKISSGKFFKVALEILYARICNNVSPLSSNLILAT